MPADPRPVLDHCGVGVTDLARAKMFYDAALGALGLACIDSFPDEGETKAYAYGLNHPAVWVGSFGPVQPRHVAFAAQNRAEVHAFHEAGRASGGQDHGVPGPRDHYEPGYCAAFLLDPDGNNIEAVFRGG